MKFLLKIFNDYAVFQKTLVEFRVLTKRTRKLSRTDLQKIANRYVMLGYNLDFLDESDVDNKRKEVMNKMEEEDKSLVRVGQTDKYACYNSSEGKWYLFQKGPQRMSPWRILSPTPYDTAKDAAGALDKNEGK